MNRKKMIATRLAVATRPTSQNRTGSWRFERPVFVERIAPCTEACPLGENIPMIMALNGKGGFEPAYHEILRENPFPGICGRLCFHPCETVCNRRRFDESVSVKDLEWFSARWAYEHNLKGGKPPGRDGQKIAVIGGGSVGLSCAFFLKQLEQQVTLLEPEKPHSEILQLTRWAEGLDAELLNWEIARVLEPGVELRTGIELKANLPGKLAEEFQAVVFTNKALQGKAMHGLSLPDPGLYRARDFPRPSVHESGIVLMTENPLSAGPPEHSKKKTSDLSRTVVRGIASGKAMAMSLDLYFRGLPFEEIFKYVLGRGRVLSMSSYMQQKAGGETTSLSSTVRFDDINVAHFKHSRRIAPRTPDGTFRRRDAVVSARRCFNCGICTFCSKCHDYCPDMSIHMNPKRREREIDYDHCKGCGICAEECPTGAIRWVAE